MLGRTSWDPGYIANCRARLQRDVDLAAGGGGRLLADKQIKLDWVGQEIAVREPEVLALAEACLADLERKYG